MIRRAAPAVVLLLAFVLTPALQPRVGAQLPSAADERFAGLQWRFVRIKYHFTTDMTDQAIRWMQSEKSLTPDKPFFMYFAPGATHAPHQVPKSWIAKYKGKFDQGWDRLREETLARQINLGVVPSGTKLAPKPEAIKDWSALSADEKKL